MGTAAAVIRSIAQGDVFGVSFQQKNELNEGDRRDIAEAVAMLDDAAMLRRLIATGIVSASDFKATESICASVSPEFSSELIKAGLDPTAARDLNAALKATHMAVTDLRSYFSATAVMLSLEGQASDVASEMLDLNLTGVELLRQATMLAVQSAMFGGYPIHIEAPE
nr:hypothetical protein TetV2_00344 [Oceanusvirus sp.]